jgi:hypothetical protein
MKMTSKKPQRKSDDKETFRIPRESSRILTELTARIALDSGTRVTKTDILAGLLDFLRAANIKTNKIESAEDVIGQLKEHIRVSKKQGR